MQVGTDFKYLENILKKPEFLPFLSLASSELLEDKRIRDGYLESEFQLTVEALQKPGYARFLLRYGFERRFFPKWSNPLTHNELFLRDLLCLNIALVYVLYMESDANCEAMDSMKPWQIQLCRLVRDWAAGVLPATSLADAYLNCISDLLQMPGSDIDEDQLVPQEIHEQLVRMLPLAVPVEILLTQGGDTRLALDREQRLNKYGCSPMPRPWAVTFSSCTATSISERSFLAAVEAWRSIVALSYMQDIEKAGIIHANRIRNSMHAMLDFPTGSEVILGSSGTDVELMLTALLLKNTQQNLVNIVIAPDEVGGGTTIAAQAKHFDTRAPLGADVEYNSAIAGFNNRSITVEKINVRSEKGSVLSMQEIDARVCAITQSAIDEGNSVLLHLLDSSKTGIGGPSIDTVTSLCKANAGKMWVVADIAQMRISSESLNRYLHKGFFLIITGSKFYTGPPFSGAIVIPPAASDLLSIKSLPEGLWEYFAAAELPDSWSNLRAQAKHSINVGLLIRWAAALAEMKAFEDVPLKCRTQYFQEFKLIVAGMIDASKEFELVSAPVLSRAGSESNEKVHWDKVQTILTFTIKSKGMFLDMADATAVYHWLNRDISRHLPVFAPTAELKLATCECHIGQPVKIAQTGAGNIAALRIAPGARFVSRVYSDPELGSNPDERLKAQVNDVRTILQKISLVLKYWNYLEDVRPALTEGQRIYTPSVANMA